jgi:NIPSNAP
MLYELRHYTTPDTTTLGAFVAWYGKYIVPAYAAAGTRIVGCWTVELGQQPRFTAILAYDDANGWQEERAKFNASDEWRQAREAQQAGMITGMDTAILEPTPYSPDPLAFASSGRGIWEERVYRGKTSRTMARVNQRFAEHTVHLFQKHGINPVAFWNVVVGADQPSIYYLVRYDDLAQRQPAWAAFRSDPAWQRAYAESEENGPLLLRTTSTLLMPTAFSPMQ